MPLRLHLGPRATSAESLAAYLVASLTGVALDLVFAEEGATVGTSARVPALEDGGQLVWTPLAIAEHLAERFPERGLWPTEQRAFARSLASEVAMGLPSLPLDLRAPIRKSKSRADLARLEAMLSEAVARTSPRPFLFGPFSAADAFLTPLALTLVMHGYELTPQVAAYFAELIANPETKRWIDKAKTLT